METTNPNSVVPGAGPGVVVMASHRAAERKLLPGMAFPESNGFFRGRVEQAKRMRQAAGSKGANPADDPEKQQP